MNIYGISFNDKGKVYDFGSDISTFKMGDLVIVSTERGIQLGKVIKQKGLTDSSSKLKKILRLASEQDYDDYLKNKKDAKEALLISQKEVKSLGLKMNLIDAEYNFDKTQLLLNFTAYERVDFRDLVKKLAYIFKTRIELHQIGARDMSKNIGGLGICGRGLCCSEFLTHIEGVSINMAKNQNIALNPSKINGQCGRLLCCLSFENEQYSCCSVGIPNVGQTVDIEGTSARVVSVDILNRKYKAIIKDELREIELGPCPKKV